MALNEALGYAFDPAAAVSAARAALEGLDHETLLTVASVLAGFTASHLQPRDLAVGSLGEWPDLHLMFLAIQDHAS
ncbi:hypothetical protein [Dactylosporangium sp. NPDC051484]|uniref:hypothetical protein n=1 Tax=Dactylosporangium sp. NPDC051484 TaxID=3154942 RepID=UPI00344E66E3